MMNLYLLFRQNGFSAPFYADTRARGTIVDRDGKIAPAMLLPGLMDNSARLSAAEMIADLLNAQAQQFEGRRLAA